MLLTVEFRDYGSTDGFLSVIIALLFFGTVYCLEAVGRSQIMKPWMRGLLADYAYPIATIFWTGFSHIPGTIRDVTISTLDHTPAFYPTTDRPWVVDWWTLDARWVFSSMPLGFLMMLLFYYDHVCYILSSPITQLNVSLERQQYFCSGQAISVEEAWWLSLGFLPYGLFMFRCRNAEHSTTKRSCTSSTGPYRCYDRV